MPANSTSDIRVSASSPIEGTVTFSAQRERAPIEGIEISIDDEARGFTGSDGRLKVEWLAAGSHSWVAFNQHDQVAQGTLQIAGITDVEFLGMWVERDGQPVKAWYPLKDTLACCIGLRNTGTTLIQSFQWKQTTYMDDAKVDLLHPKMPSFVWRPLAGGMSSTTMGRDIFIQDGNVEVVNSFTSCPEKTVLRMPVGPEGLRPGETIITEEKRPYIDWIEENMKIKAAELNTEVSMEVVDADRGILRSSMKEIGFGFMKFHDARTQTEFRGKFRVEQELLIGGKTHANKEVWFEFL